MFMKGVDLKDEQKTGWFRLDGPSDGHYLLYEHVCRLGYTALFLGLFIGPFYMTIFIFFWARNYNASLKLSKT